MDRPLVWMAMVFAGGLFATGTGAGCSSSSGGSGPSSGSSGGGSSSGSSSGGAPTSTGCLVTSGGMQQCHFYTGLDVAEIGDEDTTCASGGGTTVTSCPTANEVGCCAYVSSGVHTSLCSYCGQPALLMATCTAPDGIDGAWTAGPGGAESCGPSDAAAD